MCNKERVGARNRYLFHIQIQPGNGRNESLPDALMEMAIKGLKAVYWTSGSIAALPVANLYQTACQQ